MHQEELSQEGPLRINDLSHMARQVLTARPSKHDLRRIAGSLEERGILVDRSSQGIHIYALWNEHAKGIRGNIYTVVDKDESERSLGSTGHSCLHDVTIQLNNELIENVTVYQNGITDPYTVRGAWQYTDWWKSLRVVRFDHEPLSGLEVEFLCHMMQTPIPSGCLTGQRPRY